MKLPSNEPRYLNPVIETRADLANTLIFEGLVGLDARMEPVPRLAESWEWSGDGKTLTFHLRKDVRWHDGKPFTAKDVEATFAAIRSTQAQTLWKAYMNRVESVSSPDPHTVVVTYNEPYAPALVTWTVGIIPAHVYGEGADASDLTASPANRQPTGTGPYKLGRWELGKRLMLEANDDWWHGRPNIDSIELVMVDSDDAAIEKLTNGQLDFARIDSIEDWSNTAQLPEFRERFEVSDVLEARFRLLAWNTQKKPFADPRVRQALTYALDRGRVIEEVLLGQARPLSAPLFPTMLGADPSIAPQPYDPERAKGLLEEAGYPDRDGKRFAVSMIALDAQRGPIANQTMAILRSNLDAVGVALAVDYLPTREFFRRVLARQFDAAYFGWLPDIPDPDPYALLHSSQIGSGSNYAGYSDAEVDDLLEKARGTSDREARKALYHQLHRRLAEQVPYTMLYAPYGHYAWNRRVRAVNPADVGPMARFPGIARWWIRGARSSPVTAKPVVPKE